MFTSVHYFIHLNLAIALLLGYLVFLAGVDTAVGNRVRREIHQYTDAVALISSPPLLPPSVCRLVVHSLLLCCITCSLQSSAGCCVRASCSTSCWWWSSAPSARNGGSSSSLDGVSPPNDFGGCLASFSLSLPSLPLPLTLSTSSADRGHQCWDNSQPVWNRSVVSVIKFNLTKTIFCSFAVAGYQWRIPNLAPSGHSLSQCLLSSW